jgi:beta-xylosidase
MQCIGAATGSSPVGPFTPSSTPFICQTDQGGTIDPRVFTDSNGTRWMLFKSDQNIGGADTPTKMWSQRLTPDGLGLLGQPSELMQPDEAWQGTIVEAPDMVLIDGTYWVIYSGNWYNRPEYAIGAARCAGPAGPCADSSPVPLLGSNTQGAGPGEASLYHDRTGVWLLYSPWRSMAPLPDLPPRPVYITQLGFGPSGAYLAAGGPPPSLVAPKPSARQSAP